MTTFRSILSILCVALATCGLLKASASGWTITPRGSVTINTAAVASVNELSGIAYRYALGSSIHEFIAVQDSGSQLVTLSLTLTANGSVTNAMATAGLTLSPGYDFEGVAIGPPGSVILAEESTPAVRRYNEITGAAMAVLPMPAVFSNARSNLAFESLTRGPDGHTFWTANEEALLPDGPISSTNHGTTVRLQQFTYSTAGSLALGHQYAYQVDPIHVGTTTDSRTRSGLSDLVALPDGSLLTLERSLGITGVFFGVTLYQYESRIYHVTLDGATDTSIAPYATGLAGQSYTPATKTLLWQGQAGGGFGQNLEGLALGPVLANGDWSLIGVVDNGGDTDVLSSNTIVAFTLTPPLAGDFNFDGIVDAADYVLWRADVGTTYSAEQYDLWASNFGSSLDAGSATTVDQIALAAIPEPGAVSLLVCAATSSFSLRRRATLRR